MKKTISALFLTACIFSTTIFAGDNPVMGYSNDDCEHAESYVEQIYCYVFGD